MEAGTHLTETRVATGSHSSAGEQQNKTLNIKSLRHFHYIIWLLSCFVFHLEKEITALASPFMT